MEDGDAWTTTEDDNGPIRHRVTATPIISGLETHGLADSIGMLIDILTDMQGPGYTVAGVTLISSEDIEFKLTIEPRFAMRIEFTGSKPRVKGTKKIMIFPIAFNREIDAITIEATAITVFIDGVSPIALEF